MAKSAEAFVVFTESARITVTVTRFTVHAYPGEAPEVTVIEGMVAVQAIQSGMQTTGPQVQLGRGQRARVVRGISAEMIP